MANADVVVDWQVSTTDTFSTLVAFGSVTAQYAAAHSVHVVAGGLNPDSDYYYRFRAQGQLSPVGRTRTTPAVGTIGRDLVMAFTSCSHYEEGYFTGYRRMAEENPGVILHLGDYIYEYGPHDRHARACTSATRSCRSRTTAVGTRSTRPTRISRPRTRSRRGSSYRTTMRWRTTTPARSARTTARR